MVCISGNALLYIPFASMAALTVLFACSFFNRIIAGLKQYMVILIVVT